MSVQKIQPTDTLETGFRSKYNQSVDEIIVGYEWIGPAGAQTFQTGDILQLKKFGGGFINVNIAQYYVTNASLSTQLAGLTGIPYKGDWLGAAYPSSVTVSYNGTLWRSTAATSTGDIPGVSNKWVNILAPSLYAWNTDAIYAKDNTVRYTIDGTNYQFYSLVDDNGDEPALVSTKWAVIGSTPPASASYEDVPLTPSTTRTAVTVPTGRIYSNCEVYFPEGAYYRPDNTRKTIDPVLNILYVDTFGDSNIFVRFY